MKRGLLGVAKKRAVYGRSEMGARRVATELRNHCAIALKNHYAFKSITAVRTQRLSRAEAAYWGADVRYGFTIVAENKYGGMAQAFITVQNDLTIDIDTHTGSEGAYEDARFPKDMLDCLLSAGEKAFR